MRREREEQLLAWALGFFAAYMFLLAIIGGILAYWPVPVFDIWRGGLEFAIKAREEGFAAWWEPWGAHRILLARLLFWADVAWFKGDMLPLVVSCYLLLLALIGSFWIALGEALPDDRGFLSLKIVLFSLIAGLLSLWCQYFNLMVGYQSQFYLALLLPFLSFLLLHKSEQEGAPRALFPAAAVLGVFSTFTMANGIATLPVMALYLFAARRGVLQILTILLLAALCLLLYFSGGEIAVQDPSSPPGLRGAVNYARFALLLLGSPFAYIYGNNEYSIILGQIAGAAYLLFALLALRGALKEGSKGGFRLAALSFILFLILSAGAVALGRSQYGVLQAQQSRYTSLSLTAWAALLLLYAPSLIASYRSPTRRRVFMLLAFFVMLLAIFQTRFVLVVPQEQRKAQLRTAALALELGVEDSEYLDLLYHPRSEEAQSVLALVRKEELTVFGTFPWMALRAELGTLRSPSALPDCEAAITGLQSLPDDPGHLRVEGRISSEPYRTVSRVRLLDESHAVRGIALTGASLEGSDDCGATANCFQGYLVADAFEGSLHLVSEEPACRAEISVLPQPVAGAPAD